MSKQSSRRQFLCDGLTAVGSLGICSWVAGSLFSTSVMGAESSMKKRRILIDSDTMNEIDDQFAIIRALIAPELKVEGLTAAGFAGSKDSAQRSYEEEKKLLRLMGLDGKVPLALGSSLTLKDKRTPDETAAARLIIERAMAVSDAPLYVVALGQATNLASALLMEPRIADRVVFVLIGGTYHANREPAWGADDFNWHQKWKDIAVIFESNVPVLHIPADDVSNRVVMTRDDVERHFAGRGPVYDYLASLWDTKAKGKSTWVMWDIAAIHQVIDPSHGKTIEISAPTVQDDGTVKEAANKDRMIKVLTELDPQAIFDRFWKDLDAAE
ncbi:MAG: purine nucleosidase [Verrucomicrobiales bacterium]|jgi:purine nucleosidase